VFGLILIGLVAGIITGLSPCILPVLPVVFIAGGTSRSRAASGTEGVSRIEGASGAGGGVAVVGKVQTRRNLRPFVVIAGLVISFSIFTLLGTAILTALHLPQDFLRWIGLIILFAVGLGMLVPRLGEWLERPFARLPKPKVDRDGGAFILGLGLGVLFVPCAGPVLTAITVVSASGQIGWPVVILTVSFALGAALPLLAFALAGEQVTQRVSAFRSHANRVRQIGGIILIVIAVLLAFNITDRVQRLFPAYGSTWQAKLAGSDGAKKQLSDVTSGGSTGSAGGGRLSNCADGATKLQNCGTAPEFRDISGWFNTANGKALTLKELRGKVVLIDFWTYSCINCQRTIPHLQAWNRAYKDAGLVIVGVHTPEFAFERVPSNIEKNAKDLGVTWPIAIDNGFGTWNSYSNQFWPAEYLIDAKGQIRHVHFGEGQYEETEGFIRDLLKDASATAALPGASSVADTTPRNAAQSPESYLGYRRLQNLSNDRLVKDRFATYQLPPQVPSDTFALSGRWRVEEERALAGTDAGLAFRFSGQKVFLVLGGKGVVTGDVDGTPIKAVTVQGAPTLYPLLDAGQPTSGLLTLSFTPEVEAYAFTFG